MTLDLSDAVSAAKELLGYELIHKSPEGVTAGFIVETEAYKALDAASHTYRGPNNKNKVMFEESGRLYVYFTYGMHHCVNIVTGEEGDGQGVLIRAIEPTQGIELMKLRRKMGGYNLTNGPGKLAKAMGIGLIHNGCILGDSEEFALIPGRNINKIVSTTRIGISKDKHRKWRFYIKGNGYVSKQSKL